MIDWIEAGLSAVGPTQHLLANERVDLTDDGARSRCYMFNPLLLSGEPDAPVLLLGGEYRDVWRRSPTGWQIESRVHVVTWTRNLTAT